jgi:hypothetical protein
MDRKTAAVSFLMGLLGAFVFSRFEGGAQAAPDAGRALSVRQLNLVDDAGRVRAQLAFAKEGAPGLWLMDEKGVARANLGLYGDGTGYFGLQDAQGRMIELLRSFGPREAPLLIFKHAGRDMMITGLNPGAAPTPFLMSYEAGKKKVHFGTYEGP